MSENEQSTSKLTPKQQALIAALLTSPTITDAAKTAKVADSTARRWLRQADFQAEYKEAKRLMFDKSMTGILQATRAAVGTLVRHMNDGETPAGVQVRAAQLVLDQAVQQHQLEDVTARLAELEETVKDIKG